ncbi:PTS system mannose/fructose/sorbose family transporter subunit IID [Streptococcus constellatus subsp. pharyngis]|uniref:PTS system mannose/fructose/sorbose family IID component n=1 Tax=Streptococcus constellatus subsp. pharyngis SK1060 = CCUG 46377 TaxID=1035184 RepID=F9P9X2_STRCV|nr:PTS system mannose/fructose/sorbose family transporter subunit IID [Streptococcus constellatus]AGU71958.1 putative mannose permease IID component [Streptococcus constellatus subsp. pharyngis C232]AGU73714.1 putative mannose permease IID component [Streptococcus constellatus subsp. pharyngis C818]AGU79062.1 putative mannose permease IID component [Streptococcus constellatus subsp. pharyngis C1050]EGV06914.1 PTS system mannose/fructose/sorbose family IID component [Streptococcus constellatus s
MTNSNYKLTKEDFKQINRRSLFAFQWGWNYERMQASGYLYMILPQLRKIYGDGTPELKEMMRTHTQFFNTSNFFHTLVTGIDLALEENEGVAAKDTVTGIKTGLMGPFAAIGDAIFGSTIPAIMGGLAAGLAIDGNPLGIFLWIGVTIAINVFRWKQLEFAHKEGVKLVTTMQDKLSAITDAATVLGTFMVAALIATMINFKFTYTQSFGGVTFNLQETLDKIFPRLVPALFTGFVYWLLGKKGMNSTKAIFIVIIIAIGVSALSHFTHTPILGV